MTDHMRWGVLGASDFARRWTAPAINEADNAVLAALATRDPAKAAAFAAIAPGLRVHDSYDALLADPGIDAIYIPLPNHLHVAWTIKALEAGKHVLCEKPMAMAEAEFDALIAARDASGKLAAEAFMITHHPQWHRVRELLADGAIGDLAHVDAAFSFDNRDKPGNIRNRSETGGGALRDIGVYIFGCTRFATGAEPETLDAQITWENGVDVTATIQAQFPGFSYAGMVSMRMHLRQEMTFHGTGGILRLTAPFNPGGYGPSEVHLRRGTVHTVEALTEPRQYKLQIEAFGRSVRDGAPYPCPLEFSRGTQAMIDRAFAAGAKA